MHPKNTQKACNIKILQTWRFREYDFKEHVYDPCKYISCYLDIQMFCSHLEVYATMFFEKQVSWPITLVQCDKDSMKNITYFSYLQESTLNSTCFIFHAHFFCILFNVCLQKDNIRTQDYLDWRKLLLRSSVSFDIWCHEDEKSPKILAQCFIKYFIYFNGYVVH